MNVDDEHLDNAIKRIALTPDGQMLYLFLQKILTGFPLGEPTEDALRHHHGGRKFAAELMAKMAEGIRDSYGGRDPTDGPITFVQREPARIAGRESARNFLARTDPELNPGGGPKSAA